MHAAPALRAAMATGRVWRWPNERRYYARQPPPRAAWATMPHEHALQCDVRHSSGGDRAGARTTVRIGRAARIRRQRHTMSPLIVTSHPHSHAPEGKTAAGGPAGE